MGRRAGADLDGETFAQRVAPSLLNAVGLNELVRTKADYEAEDDRRWRRIAAPRQLAAST